MFRRVAADRELFQRKFDSFFFFTRDELISLNDARASVPTQDRIVVTGRPERFGFFEPVHCFLEKIVRLEATPRRVLSQFHFCPALGHDPGIIRAVVVRSHAGQQLFSMRFADAVAFVETIGQREQKHDDGLLVVGIDGKNIEANALRFSRFVEQAVALSLFQCCGNRVFVESFQLGHGDNVVTALNRWSVEAEILARQILRFNASTLQRFYDHFSALAVAKSTQADHKNRLRRALSAE